MNKTSTKSFLLAAFLLSTICCTSAARIETADNAAATPATPAPATANENTPAPTTNAGGAETEQNAPDAVVKDLYKTHEQDYKNETDRILNGKSRSFLDKYFDKTLADFIWKDLTTHKDEVGVLDFDPFYNAQDADIKKLAVGPSKIEGERATVAVTFENYGRQETLNYRLDRQKSAWKISDIKYTDGTSLLGYFKDDAKKEQTR